MTEVILQNQARNASEHRLYVMWAMQHLEALRLSLEMLDSSNYFWALTQNILIAERTRFLNENTAYQEAAWRLLANQAVEDIHGKLRIRDMVTEKYIPDPTEPDPFAGATSKGTAIDGVPLEPGDTVALKDAAGNISKRRISRSKHANKLTLEQRRENGYKGVAKRKENQRRKQAQFNRRFYVWGITEGNQDTAIANFPTMRSAHRRCNQENTLGVDKLWVYDKQGRRWNFDPDSKSLTKID